MKTGSLRVIVPAAALALMVAGPFAGPLSGSAHAQMESREAIGLQNQILQLRRDLQVLGQQMNSGGGRPSGGYQPSYPPSYPPPGGGGGEIATQLLDRVSALEDQMRRIQGRLDELDNARQRQFDDLSKQIGDLNFRLNAGRGGTGGPPPGAPSGPPPTLGPPPGNLDDPGRPPAPPPVATPPRRTPELVLQEGNAALARRDYLGAEAAAREALSSQRGPRGTDAQFLLGEALAGQRNYGQAAVAYDDAYRRSPSGVHAQDSLLGLANALTGLNARREACAALDELKKNFPNPRADLREPAAAARGRAGCR